MPSLPDSQNNETHPTLALVLEHRFGVREGQVHDTPEYITQLSRYTRGFAEVRLMARARPAQEGDMELTDDTGLRFLPLPEWTGLVQFLKKCPAIAFSLYREALQSDAVIVRLPSLLSLLIWPALGLRGRISVEVVGDVESLVNSGVVPGKVARFLSGAMISHTKRLVRNARAVSYVSDFKLADAYPVKDGQTFVASNVELQEVWFNEGRARPEVTQLICVGTMSTPYKGFDYALKALRLLHDQGIPLRLTILGSGKLMDQYVSLARDLELTGSVEFTGSLPRDEVRRELLAADLFVLPSLTEGMPRALLEALATGLPAIGSRVGAIPQVLEDQWLVEPGDEVALAAAVERFVSLSQDERQNLSIRATTGMRPWAKSELDVVRANFLSAAVPRPNPPVQFRVSNFFRSTRSRQRQLRSDQ